MSTGSTLNIITGKDCTIQSQLLWLFGLPDQAELSFATQDFTTDNDWGLDFAARFILDEQGIEMEEPEADRLNALLEPFGLDFPKKAIFSRFARDAKRLAHISDSEPWLHRLELRFHSCRIGR